MARERQKAGKEREKRGERELSRIVTWKRLQYSIGDIII